MQTESEIICDILQS